MSNRINLSFKFFLPLLLIANYIYSDSFDFNTYNNHGIIGLINTPTARFYEEGSHGITYFDGDPDPAHSMIFCNVCFVINIKRSH